MAVLVTDPFLEEDLRAGRRACGADRIDEVWEGVYFMPPLPNDEHQEIQGRLVVALTGTLGWDSLAKIRPGVNVSDRAEGWQHNYRAPDVVVFLPSNPAVNHRTHWQGGPDFLVEILSPHDRSRDKLAFYTAL